MSRKHANAVELEASTRGTRGRAASLAGGALSAQAELLLSLQRSVGNRAVTGLAKGWQEGLRVDSKPGSLVVQRQFEDKDKVADDAVGFLRGPAERPETGAPRFERVNESGLIDGEITSDVHAHAFTEGGRVGDSTWHHCGGQGGKAVEKLGTSKVVAPFIKTKPPGKSGVAKAWVKRSTGTVKVKRSYMGVTHGPQGAYTAAPPGTVWMSPRAKDRVDKHEREHVKSAKEIHDKHIKPLEDRIDKYRGFFKAKKQGASEAAAKAALETELDWNKALTDFATEELAENHPMGPVDQTDMNKADFYADYPTKAKFRNKSGCDTYEGVGGSKGGKT